MLLPGSGDLHWKLHGKMVQLLRPGRLRAVCEMKRSCKVKGTWIFGIFGILYLHPLTEFGAAGSDD